MLLMITYEFRPENRQAAVARFLATGAPVPEGVKMIGRWHDASMRRGFVLIDSPDTEMAARHAHAWADLLTLEVLPVLDDEQLARILTE